MRRAGRSVCRHPPPRRRLVVVAARISAGLEWRSSPQPKNPTAMRIPRFKRARARVSGASRRPTSRAGWWSRRSPPRAHRSRLSRACSRSFGAVHTTGEFERLCEDLLVERALGELAGAIGATPDALVGFLARAGVVLPPDLLSRVEAA